MVNKYTLLDNMDDIADKTIQECMDRSPRQSFSLFAGAGSGKTRSLVKLLQSIKIKQGTKLFDKGQKVAVITYTNAASDEINKRLAYDSLFIVTTIHGFIWEQIKYHTEDIREYLIQYIERKIEETKIAERKGKQGTKASKKRNKDLINFQKRLPIIKNSKTFVYDPNGINTKFNALSHSEVLDIGSFFLLEKPLFQKIFIQKYPILLIDESQDTHKQIINAFLKVEELYSDLFTIGLFGDMLQRIYFNGDKNLKAIVEGKSNWKIVEKQVNHRSASRIIELNNSIRSKIDKLNQVSRTDASEGIVRFYLFSNDTERHKAEDFVREDMSKVTKDSNWLDQSSTQNLILEHHMAAKRLKFHDFFMPLYDSDDLINRTALLEGALSEIRVLIKQVVPLVNEIKSTDESKDFRIMEILKTKGGILDHNNDNELSYSERHKIAIETVKKLEKILENEETTILDIIRCIADRKLFLLPETLARISELEFNIKEIEYEETGEEVSKYDIWYRALSSPYEQILVYNKYINQETEFATHQGVKGREFPRVMAIMDNSEERGWTFNFEKEFLEEKTSHTNYLFYVICSRAEESLALVLYTDKEEEIKEVLVRNNWFFEDEIIIKNNI